MLTRVVNIVLHTNCLNHCRLGKLLGDLRELIKFHNLVIRLKWEALKVSAKRSLKIERITFSGTAVRHKRCTFMNIKVRMAKEAFVLKE